MVVFTHVKVQGQGSRDTQIFSIMHKRAENRSTWPERCSHTKIIVHIYMHKTKLNRKRSIKRLTLQKCIRKQQQLRYSDKVYRVVIYWSTHAKSHLAV